ncbi:MAG: hypothetical protein IKB07_08280 [Lachnospiraceae bacterium]|nr:hypothetical protein [Lachnospiraceae bacterium]
MHLIDLLEMIFDTFLKIIAVVIIVALVFMIFISGALFLVGWSYKWWLSVVGLVAFVIFIGVTRWICDIAKRY